MARKKISTRSEITRVALNMFLERGYTSTSAKMISEELGISTGNLTFHFPTKEHLLALLTEELCKFQSRMMERETNEGKTSLMAFCLELTAMAAICDEDPIIKDFYISAYTHKMPLELIRKNDRERTKYVFSQYCGEFSEERFTEAENLVSGIEYATLMTTESSASLENRIAGALNSIMLIYKVPEDTRRMKITKVLSLDYRSLGRRILAEFKEYIENKTE